MTYHIVLAQVNNAGILIEDGIQTFDAAAHTRLMNVNLLAVIELTHLATPELEKTKGCVINVSSVCARNVVCTYF